MEFLTLTAIQDQVKEPLSLQEEVGEGQFVESAELISYINRGIDKAEAKIHGLYEDYFLSSASLTLIQGQSDYDFPTTIYANKVRSIWYIDGVEKYEIKEIKGAKKFEEIAWVDSTDDYRFIVTDGKIRLYPAARKAGILGKIWFIRNATKLAISTDVCDIPEFSSYVVEFAKGECLAKENGGIVPQGQQNKIDAEESAMVLTLSSMIPDGHNEVELDTEHYDSHV